jgi:hypothetical protein
VGERPAGGDRKGRELRCGTEAVDAARIWAGMLNVIGIRRSCGLRGESFRDGVNCEDRQRWRRGDWEDGLAWFVEMGGSPVAPTHTAASWSSTLLVRLRLQAIELLVTMPHLAPSR